MLLLVNSTQSKFFSPATEYKDSLQSTPSGRAKEKEIFDIAIRKYAESKDESAMDAVTYKIFMYIFKDYGKESVTVYDKAGMSDRGVYSEPFSELAWAIGDSTKIVLGYECFMATADYHGRRWTAWFAPEIPVQDGPWKLRGLPGLILEAYEPKGHHHFTADGIEQTDRPIYPIYDKYKYDRMKRTDMLKSLRNDRDNSNSMIKASIGLDLGDDAPAQTEYDYLETDYR
jgi:GLPGLI family protein